MRRYRSAVTAAAGAALAAAVLAGCASSTGATTRNAVTPGPPLPSGMTVTPPAIHFIPPTVSSSP